MLGAAGLVALDDYNNNNILVGDHQRAQTLSLEIKKLKLFCCHFVETNIIFIDIVGTRIDNNNNNNKISASEVSAMCKERGLLLSVWGPQLIRMVVHRDINDDDVIVVVEILTEVSMLLLS